MGRSTPPIKEAKIIFCIQMQVVDKIISIENASIMAMMSMRS